MFRVKDLAVGIALLNADICKIKVYDMIPNDKIYWRAPES